MGTIPAIGIAAYTTYKVTFAAINFFKTRGQKNLSLFGLKIINLKDAIASILTLQNWYCVGDVPGLDGTRDYILD